MEWESLVLPSSLVGMGTHVKVGISGYANLQTMSTEAEGAVWPKFLLKVV